MSLKEQMETKYGPVQAYKPHWLPRHYVCACCIMAVPTPALDGKFCHLCADHLERETRGEESEWLSICAEGRAELREIDSLYPDHLDYHSWRYLHEEGQDLDEMIADAEEAS